MSKTIETTTQIEKILIDNFPEVNQVVTRIGAAEVPTDPMSMEESDVIITLKPKKEWVSADTKDELANKFKAALSVIPNMEVEFTQPIEMRFNELITGVRADIAIKIFGEDLDVLSKKGNEIRSLIENVDGAADIIVEKLAGLPQMNVTYDRKKIARYGLNIQDVNDLVSMGFAGKTAGSVFEGEKRFDLVMRLDKENRQDMDNLKNLYVDLPAGGKIPLSELAEVTYKKGAAKISRDDTKRRIVVGINVRNRDLQSVVDDVQKLIDENIKLPVGYSITYGGQFENLQSARARLLVAVPIALILIFILLYFAFNSVKDALLIYSAIPLSAVGGVLLLWIRGMPFSISAGVGFIALFGIAVLNGIVLIEHFKELKKQKFDSMEALIKQGTQDRLRAVLLTASAAAFGFLPMAISTSAGAEVQRPLATVVIGGLFSATILTLVVLPVLYGYFNKIKSDGKKPASIKHGAAGISILLFFLAMNTNAQSTPKTLQDLIPLAMENNAGLRAVQFGTERTDALIGSAFHMDKTQVYFEYDQNNLAVNNEPLDVFGVQQDFLFPTVYFAEKRVNKKNHNLAQSFYEIRKKGLVRDVTASYYELQYAREKEAIYKQLDSLYSDFATQAARRFELGATTYLEKITAQSKRRQITVQSEKAQKDVAIALNGLLKIVQGGQALAIAIEPVLKVPLESAAVSDSPELRYYDDRISLASAARSLEQQKLLPDISRNYFQGTNSQLDNNLYGYQVGLKIPLFFGGQSARIKASKIASEIVLEESKAYTIQLEARLQELQSELRKYEEAVAYYEEEGTLLSEEILKTANGSFRNGEIDFYQYILSLENAYQVRLDYLDNLNLYNQTVIKINYITL